MIPNQWTHGTHIAIKENIKALQVGFYKKENILVTGIFDHLLISDDQIIGLEESGILTEEEKDKFLLEIIMSFMGENKFICAYLIPDGTWCDNWVQSKPKKVSSLQWFLKSKKNKFKTILTEELVKDGIEILKPLDQSWHIGLNFGKTKKHVEKYFRRLGRNPDDEPDILYISKEPVEHGGFIRHAHTEFMYQNALQPLSKLKEEDWSKYKEVLNNFIHLFLAIDGHLYFFTQNMTQDDVLEKIQPLIKSYNLEIAKGHMLY